MFTLPLDYFVANMPLFKHLYYVIRHPSPIKARSLFSVIDILTIFTYSTLLKPLFMNTTSFQNSPKENIHSISFSEKENNPEYIFHNDV